MVSISGFSHMFLKLYCFGFSKRITVIALFRVVLYIVEGLIV